MTLTVLVPLITFPYVSRVFLPEGSGKINFVSSVIQVFILFASLGFYTYGVREGARVRDDRTQFSKLGQELLSINILSTAATYAVFLACVLLIPSFRPYRTLLLIHGVAIGFTALGMDWVFGVFEDYVYIAVRQILCQLFTVVTLFLFIHRPEDIYLYVTLNTASAVVANTLSVLYSRKYLSYRPSRAYHYEIKKHIVPILTMFATTLAAKAYNNIDTILLGFMTSDYNVGIYSAAVKINTVLITFFAAMSPVFMPRLIRHMEDNDPESYFALLKKILGMIVGLGLPAVVGIEMLSDQIIHILADTAFAPAAQTMRILAPVVLVNACANVLYYDVMVLYKQEKNVLFCTASGAVLNLILSALLIPRFAENGAAIGSVISEALALVLAFALCVRLDQRIVKGLPNVLNYGIGCALIVLWCLVCERMIPSFLLQTLAAIAGSVCLYFVALILRKDFIGNEIVRQVDKLLRRFQNAQRQ